MTRDVFELSGEEVAGAFEVEKVVGEGGFAVVYRAHHKGFKAPIALKCLKIPQHMSPEMQQQFRLQFQAEAELLFKLSSSIINVVRPLHVDAIIAPNGDFMPFMAMEWLEGETLQDYAARHSGRSTQPDWLLELVELLTPAAMALNCAHHFPGPDGMVSIVHRDIKPENLFVATVAQKRVIKLLDFGIGKAKSVASQVAGRQSTQRGGLSSFTPAYGAPEQWLPRRFGQTGPWTDVWGLALTVVELYIGSPVFDGDQAAVLGAALDTTVRPTPRGRGVQLADEVEAVFEKALAVDPRDRYQDAGSFWNALRATLGLGVSHAPPPPRPARVQNGRHSHEELDFGEAVSGPSLELASIPPAPAIAAQPSPNEAATQALPANAPAPARAAKPRMTPLETLGDASRQLSPPQLPAVSIYPASPPILATYLVPATAIFCGIVLSLLGQHYAATLGRVFSIGPVGLGWVTIPMVLGGSLAIVYRLVRRGA